MTKILYLFLLTSLSLFVTTVKAQDNPVQDVIEVTEDELYNIVHNFLQATKLGFKQEALLHYPESKRFYDEIKPLKTWKFMSVESVYNLHYVHTVVDGKEVLFYVYLEEGDMFIMDSRGLIKRKKKHYTDLQQCTIR